jgi:leader peptidase (prepilin peptidase) / N-methyltransferase
VTPLRHALAYAAPAGRYERRREPDRLLHPLAELSAIALVLGCFAAFGLSLEALSAAVLCVALVIVSVTDLEYRIVPNRVVLPAAGLVLTLNTLRDPAPEWILAALAVCLVLFAAALVNPRGMGMGDVKLAFLIGAALGWSAALALVLGIVAAFVPALVLLLSGRGRDVTMPFAPFLAFGALVALFA